jgi:hypothetical protein
MRNSLVVTSMMICLASAYGADWNLLVVTTQPSTSTAPATMPAQGAIATTSTAPAATSTAPATTQANATTKAAPVKVTREFSEPSWTLKTFAESLRVNDAESFAACFATPAKDDKVVPVYMEVVVNAVKLRRAAIARFGEEAAGQFEVASLAASLEVSRQSAMAARVRQGGASAQVRISDEIVITINRDATTGEWKIDPATYVGIRPEHRAKVEKTIHVVSAIAHAINDTSTDLDAGKHATLAQAAQAYRFHVAAMTKAAKAGNTATAPATNKAP